MSKLLRGRDVFEKNKPLIHFCIKCMSILPLRLRMRMLEKNRNTLGNIGLGLRYALVKTIARSCGDNVAIYPGVYLFNPQNISIGNNVSIHSMSYLDSGPDNGCGISIGNDVSIAHGVTIMATTHIYTDNDLPIKDQGVETKSVCINDNVWIGAKATILCGVTIENGCVIGANAVVTHSTCPDKVYVGAPARVIKDRV